MYMSEITIAYIVSVLQIILAGGLINVWLVRSGRPTEYRGRGAHNMKEEFKAYGLPVWFMYIIGFAKISVAFFLLVGLWYPAIVPWTLYLLVGLMLGAVSMHIKVRDPFKRAIPALLMLLLSLSALYFINLL